MLSLPEVGPPPQGHRMIIEIFNDITPTRLVHRLQIVGALEHHHRLKRIVPSGQIVRNLSRCHKANHAEAQA